MGENTRIVPDATCTFCGCVCDDMVLTVDLEHLPELEPLLDTGIIHAAYG